MSRAGSVRTWLAIIGLCGFSLGCAARPTPTLPPIASATAVSRLPETLNLDLRGNPPLTVSIDGVEVARFACDEGGVLIPGRAGLPNLPWDLQVVDQRSGASILATQITELPKWILMFGAEIGIGDLPAAGPPGPSCPPG